MDKEVEKYMNLNYPVSFVKEDDDYYVWYEDLPGCRADGKTLEEALNYLDVVKRDWIELALERGMNVPKPGELSRYSGKLLLRLPVELHREIVLSARRNKTSVNTYIINLLSRALSSDISRRQNREDKRNIADLIKEGEEISPNTGERSKLRIWEFSYYSYENESAA